MAIQTASLVSRVTPGKSKRDDFKIESDKVALLIIDVQENLNLAKRADQLQMKNIQTLLDATRKSRSILQTNGQKGSEVIFTYLESLTDNSRDVSLDYKLSGYLAKLPSPSEPAKFVENISPVKGHDILIPKTSCSVFNSTNIDYVLRNLGIEQIVLCGQLTNECVESTARDAADLGYFVTVAEDACLAMSVDSHKKGLFGMKGFARIITTSQVVQEFNASSPNQINVAEPNVEELADSSKLVSSKSSLVPYQPLSMEQGAVKALLTALRFSNVRHVRFGFVDVGNAIRCKAIPLHRLNPNNLNSIVNIATIVSAGLPSYGDLMIEGSGITAAGNLTLHPDLSSLRVLPYAQSSAMIMCYQYAKQHLSTFCTRALLHQVLQTAETKHGLQFCVGAELEFCLYKEDGIEPVDLSLFAHTKTLNQQEPFICELEDMLTMQGIEIELIHAESAGGQCELVLKYQDDVLALADNVILAKETITECARKHAMKAIFLPKISAMQAGNGLHLHFSFYDKTLGAGPIYNAFPDYSQKESISSKGKSFMEGILKHLPSLLSFTLPTQNSFRRVGVGVSIFFTSQCANKFNFIFNFYN